MHNRRLSAWRGRRPAAGTEPAAAPPGVHFAREAHFCTLDSRRLLRPTPCATGGEYRRLARGSCRVEDGRKHDDSRGKDHGGEQRRLPADYGLNLLHWEVVDSTIGLQVTKDAGLTA